MKGKIIYFCYLFDWVQLIISKNDKKMVFVFSSRSGRTPTPLNNHYYNIDTLNKFISIHYISSKKKMVLKQIDIFLLILSNENISNS